MKKPVATAALETAELGVQPCIASPIPVSAVRLWALERAGAPDSYILSVTTEDRGRCSFRIGALDLLGIAEAVLADRDLPPRAVLVQ
jgi:hypothetical protein